MNSLIVIDSNYLCFIEKFGMSVHLSYKGGRTDIIYGFFRHILSLARKFETTDFAFVFDSKTSLRKRLYPGYKEGREKAKEKLTQEQIEDNKRAYVQFSELRIKALPMFPFPNVFTKEGYESDDIIASIVKKEHLKRHCIVVTSDTDLFQLLNYCNLYNVVKATTMTRGEFVRNYKILPPDWVTVKQIAGCVSDSVKGVRMVGEKKAIAYIRGELRGKSLAAIEDNSDLISRNEKLVKLPFKGTGDYPIENIDHYSLKSFKKLCKNYGFMSFLSNVAAWQKMFNMK